MDVVVIVISSWTSPLIFCSELINDIRSCSRKKHPYGEGIFRVLDSFFPDDSRGKLITIESKISVSCTNQLSIYRESPLE